MDIKKDNNKNDKNNDNFTFPKTIKRYQIKTILNQQVKNTENEYITGTIKINNIFSRYAYVSIDDKNINDDILIEGYRDRNRAMEKDVVVVQLKTKNDWIQKSNGNYQKTAKVVCILEKVHTRKAIGILENHDEVIKFRPRDPKFPILTIDTETLPDKYDKNTLFMAKIKNWSAPNFCTGKILSVVGNIGDFNVETEAILLENGLDVTPYDDESMKDIPSIDYKLSNDDFKEREDLRDNCIFTIDPATAVDLDDAVSCEKLNNGNYKVGVHIADVTHFLKTNTKINEKISKRATTIYLVNRVYHMLPKSLCKLCSLSPGNDKLGFSIIWEMTPDAQIISHKFSKTIINSSCQMSYEQAQKLIDYNKLKIDEFNDKLDIKNGYKINDLSIIVNDLYKLSKVLRNKRFNDGALKIDQPKIHIVLDEITKLPVTYKLEERLDSNNLIEEFMLLANMTVAKHIYEKFPDTALLRHHNPPKEINITRTFNSLRNFGINLNTNSAGELQASIEKLRPIEDDDDDKFKVENFLIQSRMMVIQTLCAQSMMRANYVCSGNMDNELLLHHYALNVPFYTHFTSPIRRYADCIVHRLLYSSLTGDPMPTDWSSELCTRLANNCNQMKNNAKNAQEKSTELYFTQLVGQNGPTETLAVVMYVKEQSIDAILCHVGMTIKIELSNIKNDATVNYTNDDSIPTVTVKWNADEVEQVINVFSIIRVKISKHVKSYSLRTTLLPPKFCNSE